VDGKEEASIPTLFASTRISRVESNVRQVPLIGAAFVLSICKSYSRNTILRYRIPSLFNLKLMCPYA